MTPDWLQPLIVWLTANPGWLTLAVFTIALLESLALAGILVPGMAILFAVTVLAGKAGSPLPALLIWTALGAIAGDLLSFWLGRKLKGRLHHFWPFSRHPVLIRKAESLFVSHGGVSVLIGRFIGPIRPVLPMVAGAFSMPSRQFALFNVLSAAIWAPFSILPGYAIGNTLASPVHIPRELYPLIAISAVSLVLAYILFFRVQLGLRHQSTIYRWLHTQLDRHPRLNRFWRHFSSERPGTTPEFPLASVSLATAGVAGISLWLILTYTTGLPLTADHYFLALSDALQFPPGHHLANLLSGPFTPEALAGGLCLATAVLLLKGHYAAALHWLLATVLTLLTVTLILALPRTLDATPYHGTSMPDSVTALLTLTAGLLAASIARERPPARRWQVYGLLSLPVLVVVLSRLYLGDVWFTEAISGLLVGLTISGLTRTSFSRFDHEPIRSDLFSRAAVLIWLVLAMTGWLLTAGG